MTVFGKILINMSFLCFVSSVSAQAPANVPVAKFIKEDSSVRFAVKASVAIEGTFNKWDATLTYTSRDVEAWVLDIKIQSDSVNTGSGMKDDKLRSKDFFNAKDDPYITFHSTKIVQTGPMTFDIPGTFTIRGVSRSETLTFTGYGTKGSGVGEIKGTMAFDRKGTQPGLTERFRLLRVSETSSSTCRKTRSAAIKPKWSRLPDTVIMLSGNSSPRIPLSRFSNFKRASAA